MAGMVGVRNDGIENGVWFGLVWFGWLETGAVCLVTVDMNIREQAMVCISVMIND